MEVRQPYARTVTAESRTDHLKLSELAGGTDIVKVAPISVEVGRKRCSLQFLRYSQGNKLGAACSTFVFRWCFICYSQQGRKQGRRQVEARKQTWTQFEARKKARKQKITQGNNEGSEKEMKETRKQGNKQASKQARKEGRKEARKQGNLDLAWTSPGPRPDLAQDL